MTNTERLLEQWRVEIQYAIKMSQADPKSDEWPERVRSLSEYTHQLEVAIQQDKKRPDPLGEALNSGDGSYKP